MYLKSLSLTGFKSFANPTSLEFGQGITAIVGPNGSGKSNIVDALVWALGERSNKALRGRSSTDVIFSGSNKRKASQTAKVSLFFDNSDKSLPVDTSIVRVRRQLSRESGSEYSINQNKCRMRDILELFLDTGIGPESFSVVSQGEIDAILSAKPEDRRHLIEGAAGVQKYHARRFETWRKLDRVQTDLQRVVDITSELETQLKPLAKQAELAKERDNYEKRLRVLQLAILAQDFMARSQRLEKYRGGHSQVSVDTQTHAAEVEKLESVKDTLEKKMRALESTFDEAQRNLTEAATQLKATEGEIAVAHERRRALSEQQDLQAKEIGQLRERIGAAQQKAQEVRARWEESKQSQGDLFESAAAAEKLMGEANAALSEATEQLQELQAKVIAHMRKSQQNRELAATNRAESTSFNNRREELNQSQADFEKEIQRLAEVRQEAQEKITAADSHLQDITKKAEESHQQWQRSQQEQEQLSEMLSDLREERSSVESRLHVLRELEENLEGVAHGSRAVLRAVQRGDLPDYYTLVADAVKSPQELELAVEIALGAGVHNLICEQDSDAKTAINWLKQHRAGRATFLPLSNLHPTRVSHRTKVLLSEPGVHGLASELVYCDAGLQDAVDYLLGRVLIVDDIDTAIALSRRCDGGMRLVTLEGEVVLPSGAITGGAGRRRSAGLLSRKRELEELETRVYEFSQKLESSKKQLQEAAVQANSQQKTWRATQEKVQDARSLCAKAERELQYLDNETQRVNAQKKAIAAQIQQVQQQITKRNEQLKQYETTTKELEKVAQILNEDVIKAQQFVADKQAAREKIAGEVGEVRAKYSASWEQLSAMQREIQTANSAIEDFKSQIVTKQAAIDAAVGENAELVTREVDLTSLLAQLQGQRERFENSLQTARRERSDAIAKLQENDQELKKKRAALREIEEKQHLLAVQIASTETEITELQRRFEEEFHISQKEALTYRNKIDDKDQARNEIKSLRRKLNTLGNIGSGVITQYEQMKERLEFLTEQRTDLDKARAELESIIADIDARTRKRFLSTFNEIKIAFEDLFVRIFDGGSTALALTTPDNLLETGIDLQVQLPGKAKQDISLLSGGERALTALAFMLALLRVRPSPFVVLDEVDAPLDQSNVVRFAQLLREFTDKTQFIVITHNNNTMQAADVLYGVTQQEQGISTLMSVRLADAAEMAETLA